MKQKTEIKFKERSKNIVYVKQNEFLYSIDNEIFHHSANHKQQKIKKISKFQNSIFKIKRNVSYLNKENLDYTDDLFLACDTNTIKLFTLTHNIFTHYSKSKINDFDIFNNVIMFSTLEGVFMADPMKMIKNEGAEDSIESEIKQIFEGPFISVGYLPVTNLQNLFKNIEDSSIQNIRNINQLFESMNFSSQLQRNSFLIENIVFATENTLHIGNSVINIQNIRCIKIIDQCLAVILNHGVLFLSLFDKPKIEFYHIPGVRSFIKKGTVILPYTDDTIYHEGCIIKNFNSNILIAFEENNDHFLMTYDRERYKIVQKGDDISIEPDIEDLNWIFDPPIENTQCEMIAPEEPVEKKTIRYKKPKHPVFTLFKAHPLRNDLDCFRDAIRTHQWQTFFSLLKTKKIAKPVQSQLLNLFIEKIFLHEPVKVRKNILRGNEDLLLEAMNDECFIKTVGLFCNDFFAAPENHFLSKKFSKRLKEILQFKKKLSEIACKIDLKQ